MLRRAVAGEQRFVAEKLLAFLPKIHYHGFSKGRSVPQSQKRHAPFRRRGSRSVLMKCFEPKCCHEGSARAEARPHPSWLFDCMRQLRCRSGRARIRQPGHARPPAGARPVDRPPAGTGKERLMAGPKQSREAQPCPTHDHWPKSMTGRSARNLAWRSARDRMRPLV